MATKYIVDGLDRYGALVWLTEDGTWSADADDARMYDWFADATEAANRLGGGVSLVEVES